MLSPSPTWSLPTPRTPSPGIKPIWWIWGRFRSKIDELVSWTWDVNMRTILDSNFLLVPGWSVGRRRQDRLRYQEPHPAVWTRFGKIGVVFAPRLTNLYLEPGVSTWEQSLRVILLIPGWSGGFRRQDRFGHEEPHPPVSSSSSFQA